MRPPSQPQSRVLRPLNDILATPANVRLIRVLTLSPTSVTAGEVARRADLGRTSIYPALRALEFAGIVEFVGAGAQRQVALRKQHPLAGPLTVLFQAEARRFDDLTTALRELFVAPPARPVSAWIEDVPTADRRADHLRLYFVVQPDEKEALSDYLTERLPDVERTHDIHILVSGLTRSELETLARTQTNALDNPTLLDGVPPIALLSAARERPAASRLASHGDHDARARRLGVAIAAKIKRDPGLIAVARQRLERRAQKAGLRESRELKEWMRLLSTMSPARLRAFLVENSERAIRLRQSLPALNLLSPAERQAVLRSQTDDEVIAAVRRR